MALLVALAVTGIAVQAFELVDASALLDWARGLAAHWWLAVALVLLQVVLSTFALPGSAGRAAECAHRGCGDPEGWRLYRRARCVCVREPPHPDGDGTAADQPR